MTSTMSGSDLSLRSLRDRPFELLKEMERRSRTVAAGSAPDTGAGREWVGVAFRMGGETFLVAREETREVLGHPAVITRRIQRHRKRGTGKYYVYVYPAKKALAAIKAKIKAWCRQNINLPLKVLLIQLNRMLRGWAAHFKYGCSNATFSYLRSYLWKQVIRWQERKQRRTPWKQLRRRYGIWPSDGGVELFDPARVSARRYYYRGTKIAAPWPSTA